MIVHNNVMGCLGVSRFVLRCNQLNAKLNAIAFGAITLMLSAGARAENLSLATEDYPPFNIVDSRTRIVTGISTEKVMELMRRAGDSYQINAYPWSRTFQTGLNDKDACIFSTARTAQREAKFKWVGPLVKKYAWVVFGRADDARHPKNLADLRPYIVGAYRKGAAAELLSLKGFKIDLANYDSDNPRKLLYGRFDFWAAGKSHGMAILRAQGLEQKIVPLFEFYQGEMYLACHVDMPQERIDHYNQILKEMERDGTVKAIENKYRYRSSKKTNMVNQVL